MAGGGQVCRFFLEGRCKFGAQCRYRHPSAGGGGRGGGGNWNNRRGGGRHQGDPVDSGRRWDQKGGNRFQLFSDGGGDGGGYQSYGDVRRWDDQGRNQWGGGWRGGRLGWGGRGGGTRSTDYGHSSSYQNQRNQNDQYHYQTDRFSGHQQNWSSGGHSSFSDSRRSSNYQNSYGSYHRGGARYGGYDSSQQASEIRQPEDPREIAAQIRLDMEDWSNSHMWPLSCYAYYKETPCLPGFTDVSPEELRWEAYQAKSGGNSEHFLKAVSQLNEARIKTVHEFSNMTRDDVKDMLLNVNSNVERSQPSSLFAPSTTGTTTSSLFGHETPSSSLFGSQKPIASSLFQSTPPSTTSASLLQPPKSLFGEAGSHGLQLSTATDKQPIISQDQGTHQTQSQELTQRLITTQPDAQKMESTDVNLKLTDKELEAFKADKFTLGQIPEHAPPDALCN